jgi:hypothetical protein
MTFTTEHKSLIRQQWAKPLLKFLSRRLGHKLVYLGLPSPEAEDVMEWLEYLHSVIAFQCDDERYPDAYIKLFEKLNSLEKENKLNTFQTFKGYIEEVVLQGYDNSNEAQIFNLNELITLYNLDFCNSIDSPIEILDSEGNLNKIYKFHAINKLLEIQKSVSSISNKFILFLTVHCSFKGGELAEYLETCNHKEYVNNVRDKLISEHKSARIVRLFVIDTLQNYFRTFGFIPKILPTIFYNGIKDASLLHFTVLGIRQESVGLTPWLQDFTDLINAKFITVEGNSFVNLNITEIEEVENSICTPVEIMANSMTFKKYWQKI